MKTLAVLILKRLNLLFLIDYLKKVRFFHFRFHHPYRKLDYKCGIVVNQSPENLDDEVFLRLVYSIKDSIDYSPTSQWKDIFNEHQYEVIQSLRNQDFVKIKRILGDPLSSNLMYGFDNLAKTLRSKFRLETSKECAMTADHFLALAEYLGVVKYESPESLTSPKKKSIDMHVIIDNVIAKAFNKKVVFPNFYPGETGIVTSFGIASLRCPAAIYQASKILKLGDNICEIGPGLGRTAYFAKLLGAKKYTLVDIPVPSLCQGYV